jgi:signal transduction histidine kinase
MTTLRAAVAANRDLLVFAYGLVFFIMGVAVALQARRTSRLELARSLAWLAAFGILHGLHEWGDVFIPIQAAYLPAGAVGWLRVVQLALLVASFVCLFEFGLSLLRSPQTGRWPQAIPLVIAAVWLVVALTLLPALAPDRDTWARSANGLARYWIAFPAALVAAYSLRRQTLRRVKPLEVPGIVHTLQIAGWLLVAYALVAGLVPPLVPFPPGNWLNTTTFTHVLGLPPIVFRSLIGLGLALTFIRALDVFDVETTRRIESMEQQQILNAERERIGRDLHDGAIQAVYSAGLLVESARNLAEPESLLATRLDRSLDALDRAIRDLRRNLGELQAAPGPSLPDGLRQLAADPRFSSLVDVKLTLDLPGDDPVVPSRADHVVAIVQEALANVVRHARARRVLITAAGAGDRLVVTVQDDGAGLPAQIEAGFGLRNMRDRARLLGGELEVSGARGKGTSVRLDVPLRDAR